MGEHEPESSSTAAGPTRLETASGPRKGNRFEAQTEVVEDASIREAAESLLNHGRAAYLAGSTRSAVGPLSTALQHFRQLADSAGIVEAAVVLGRAERDLGDFDSARKHFDEALDLAQSRGDRQATCEALNLRASIHKAQGEGRLALECLESALEIAIELGLVENQVNLRNNMGLLHAHRGDFAVALTNLTEANKLVREHSLDPGMEAKSLGMLSAFYRQTGDYSKSRSFASGALEVSRRAGDKIVECATLNNLAVLALDEEQWEAAKELFIEALRFARKLGHPQFEIDNLDGLGQVYVALGQYEWALDVHFRALALAREIGESEGELEALLNVGRDLLAVGHPDEALTHLKLCPTLASNLDSRPLIYETHRLLARAYEELGDTEAALHHYKQYHLVEKAVFNEESEERTRQLSIRLDLERSQHEAQQERLRTQAEKQARERAEELVRDRTKELREAHLEVVTRLALAAEYRDDATGQHTWRVGRNAAAIARALNWRDDEVEQLFQAARLHDVGKIGIRDVLLLKPGRLSQEEMEVMQAHTTIGAQLLSGGRSRLLQLAEEIARAHHEHWDGRGYPLGLAGEAIPESARIVAVADVLDALVHERPYKKGWPVSKALGFIREQSGSQFDPRVVSACLDLFGKGGGLSPLSIDRHGLPISDIQSWDEGERSE